MVRSGRCPMLYWRPQRWLRCRSLFLLNDCFVVAVGHDPHRVVDQVRHTRLNGGLGPGRLDCYGQADEPVTAHDQDISDTAVGQVGADPGPELGSLAVLQPDQPRGLRDAIPQPDRGSSASRITRCPPNRVKASHHGLFSGPTPFHRPSDLQGGLSTLRGQGQKVYVSELLPSAS